MLDLVEIACWVAFWRERDRMGFLHYHCIVGTVNGRIHSHSEDVLVILRESARRDDIAVVGGFAGVDVDHGDDSRGARLDGNAAGLVEFVGEDVFVVG